LVAVATVSKFVGSWAGARLSGLENREGFALGMALNARGALGIIIAAVGLDLGVFNDASYVIVVVMAIATSVVAPPALRALVSGWSGSAEEQARLKREEQLAGNLVVRSGNMLLPVTSANAAPPSVAFLGHGFPAEMGVTLLSIPGLEPSDATLERCTELLGERRVDRADGNGDAMAAVSAQLEVGYDLTVALVPPDVEWPDIDEVTRAVLAHRETPVVLLRPTAVQMAATSGFRRVLLPVSATRPSRAAAELAISFAAASGAVVKLLHVNPTEAPTQVQRIIRSTFRSHERTVGSYADPVGQQLLQATMATAREAGVRCDRIFSEQSSKVEAIVDAAASQYCDLILLGVEAQEVGGEAFLGQTTRRVLATAPTAVGVVVWPSA